MRSPSTACSKVLPQLAIPTLLPLQRQRYESRCFISGMFFRFSLYPRVIHEYSAALQHMCILPLPLSHPYNLPCAIYVVVFVVLASGRMCIQMPGLLSATPEPLVKSAALGINNKVLEYVSNTFISTVAGDYREWARDQKQA